jgi:hypothetical protein
VSIIHQTEIASWIDELGMVSLPRAEQYPLMQWLSEDGELWWGPEFLGPWKYDGGHTTDGYEMLPAAATYPDELHPADQRLRKMSFEPAPGERYVLWYVLGSETDGGLSLAASVLPGSDWMYRHREQR